MNNWGRIAALYEGRKGDHFEIVEGDWRDVGHGLQIGPSHLTVSSDGMDEMVAQARVMDRCAPLLDELTPFLGRCEHGLDIEGLMEEEGWHWSINDYVEFAHNHRDTELVLIIGGFHPKPADLQYPFPDIYCIPWAFNPAGVLYPW